MSSKRADVVKVFCAVDELGWLAVLKELFETAIVSTENEERARNKIFPISETTFCFQKAFRLTLSLELAEQEEQQRCLIILNHDDLDSKSTATLFRDIRDWLFVVNDFKLRCYIVVNSSNCSIDFLHQFEEFRQQVKLVTLILKPLFLDPEQQAEMLAKLEIPEMSQLVVKNAEE